MGISFRYMPCQVPPFWRQIQYFSNSLAMAKNVVQNVVRLAVQNGEN